MEDEKVAKKIEQLEEYLAAPDFEMIESTSANYKCMICGETIRRGSKCLYVPINKRYCCCKCGNERYDDIAAHNERVRSRKAKELKNLKNGKQIRKPGSKSAMRTAASDTEVRKQIRDKCRELFGPYKQYSSKVINAEVDRLVGDGKTEYGILYALNWWYKQPSSDPKKANGKLSIIDFVYGEAMRDYISKQVVCKSLKNAEEVKTVTVVAYEDERKPRIKLFDLQ